MPAKAVRETKDALLVVLANGLVQKWIPKSVIDDDSEVYRSGTDGKLVIAEWWAEKHGLAPK